MDLPRLPSGYYEPQREYRSYQLRGQRRVRADQRPPEAKSHQVYLLPRTISGRHILHPRPPENVILYVQRRLPMHDDVGADLAGLLSTTRLRREDSFGHHRLIGL